MRTVAYFNYVVFKNFLENSILKIREKQEILTSKSPVDLIHYADSAQIDD